MKEIKTGCSGFYNKYWKDVFCAAGAPQGKWFELYTQQLNVLELNVTFHQFPTVDRLKKWHDQSPDHFSFAVKAPRTITHHKKLLDCNHLLCDFYAICREGLQDKLACLLFQFPPDFEYNRQNLSLVLRSMRPGFKNVVEFRHASWWNKEVYNLLEINQIIFCSVDHPSLPDETVINNETAYVRLHGNPEVQHSDYSIEQLTRLYYTLHQTEKVKEAFVFFNNTAGTTGIVNAQEFNKMAVAG